MLSGLAEKISVLIEPVVVDAGAELVDVVYLSEHGRWVLRVYVDKDGGINIDEISRISREISSLLDVEDIIERRYSLEVSSPGLDRPLTKPEHFRRVIGKDLRLRTVEPIEGRRNFKGTLEGFSGDKLTIKDSDGLSFEVEFGNIDRARLDVAI